MKILLINKYLYPRRGAETHFLDLYRLLNRENEVKVFGMEHPENPAFEEKDFFVPYVGYHEHDSTFRERFFGLGRIFWSFAARRQLRRLLAEWRPDIAHIHNVYHQLSFSVLRELKSQRIPIAMTVHDYHLISPDKDVYYPEIGKHFYRFLWYPKYSFGKRLILVLKMYWERLLGGYGASVSVFIVPSAFVRQQLMAFGIDDEKIQVLPHFIPEAPFENVGQAKEDFLLTLGGASTLKGTPELETIARKLGSRLIICGAVDEGYKKNTDPLISYEGQVGKEKVQELIGKAKAVVSASRLPETFGLVALESLACGTPFFCLDAGAYKEIVRSGSDGEVCASTEALKEALQAYRDGQKTYDAEAIARSAAERFGSQKYKERLLALYQSMLSH